MRSQQAGRQTLLALDEDLDFDEETDDEDVRELFMGAAHKVGMGIEGI